jgi:hypothetical protein
MKRERIRTVHNDIRSLIDWSALRSDWSGKPFIPVFEAPMRLSFINIIVIIVNKSNSLRTEPTFFMILHHILQRHIRAKHLLIVIEDVLEMSVNLRIQEECLTISSVQEINKDSVKRDSGNVSIVELRGMSGCVADHVEKSLRMMTMEHTSSRDTLKGTLETHSQGWVLVDIRL